jgi:hypothetical protein
VVFSPTNICAGVPFTSSSATTKISDRAVSITGVPVIPTLGVISPHGSEVAGTGVPICEDQMTEPVEDDNAYTVLLSVAM